MINGNIFRLDEYLRNNPGAFDLYIGSISFEERCLGAAKMFRKTSQNIKRIYFID
ncbi:unnamed protein product, partial [marine sediment metagenome]